MPLLSRARRPGPSWAGPVAAVCLVASVLAAAPDASAGIDPPLLAAVQDGDAAGVRAALADGTDVNRPAADGTTALHWAARLDLPRLADLLLEAGADATAANAFGVTPLALAAVNGSAAMLDNAAAGRRRPECPGGRRGDRPS